MFLVLLQHLRWPFQETQLLFLMNSVVLQTPKPWPELSVAPHRVRLVCCTQTHYLKRGMILWHQAAVQSNIWIDILIIVIWSFLIALIQIFGCGGCDRSSVFPLVNRPTQQHLDSRSKRTYTNMLACKWMDLFVGHSQTVAEGITDDHSNCVCNWWKAEIRLTYLYVYLGRIFWELMTPDFHLIDGWFQKAAMGGRGGGHQVQVFNLRKGPQRLELPLPPDIWL